MGLDLDVATRKRSDRGARLVEVLKQGQFEVLSMEEQVCILFAANEGFLDEVPVEEVAAFEKKLLEYLKNLHEEILTTIRESKDLTEETQEQLKKALREYGDQKTS